MCRHRMRVFGRSVSGIGVVMYVSTTRIPWRHIVLFGWLPSPLKVLAYRLLLGYRIGRGVRFSFGGGGGGKGVEIGEFVEIGFLAVGQGRRIRIGRDSSARVMSYGPRATIEICEDAR